MSIKLNTSGMPAGTGSLQMRGRVWWAIYTDETGNRMQVNTETANITEARRVLARAAVVILERRLAALRRVLNESVYQPGTPARRKGNARISAQADARSGQKNPQGGSR